MALTNNKKKYSWLKKTSFIMLILLTINIYLPGITFAESSTNSGSSDSGALGDSVGKSWNFAEEAGLMPNGNVTTPSQIIEYVLNGVLALLALVLLVLIIYSGFMWMTSAGSDEKIKKAKSTLKNAIMGIIIIMFSFIITQFVFSIVNQNTKSTSDDHSIFSF